MLKIITFNAALQDVRILNRSVYCPLGHIHERLTALAPALLDLDADIVFLQEVFHHKLQHALCQNLAGNYPYIAGLTSRSYGLRLGNELLTFSRYPLDKGNLIRFRQATPEELRFTSKGFYHSKISIPEIGQVDLINIHATAGGVHAHPEDDGMETIRTDQIEQILSYIRSLDRVILAGDLNAGPHTSRRNYQQLLDAGFLDLFAQASAEGVTWDPENPLVANGNEQHLPEQRIDHIFINTALSKSIRPVDAGIVLDKHCATVAGTQLPLSDHYGVLGILDRAD